MKGSRRIIERPGATSLPYTAFHIKNESGAILSPPAPAADHSRGPLLVSIARCRGQDRVGRRCCVQKPKGPFEGEEERVVAKGHPNE